MTASINRLDVLIEEVFKLRDTAKAVSIASEQIIFDLEKLRLLLDSSHVEVVEPWLARVTEGVTAIRHTVRQIDRPTRRELGGA